VAAMWRLDTAQALYDVVAKIQQRRHQMRHLLLSTGRSSGGTRASTTVGWLSLCKRRSRNESPAGEDTFKIAQKGPKLAAAGLERLVLANKVW